MMVYFFRTTLWRLFAPTSNNIYASYLRLIASDVLEYYQYDVVTLEG